MYYFFFFVLGILQRSVEWMTRRRRCWFILRDGIIVMMSGSHLIVNVWDHMDVNICLVRPKMKRFDDNFYLNHFYYLISWIRKIDRVLAMLIINSWLDIKEKKLNDWLKLLITAELFLWKFLSLVCSLGLFLVWIALTFVLSVTKPIALVI